MKQLVICLPLLLLLCGCDAIPFARELESTMLVQVLGVDWDENGVTLTAACDPTAAGGSGTQPVLSASGEDLAQAKAALQGSGEQYVALTHVAQLVLGARTDLAKVLSAALEEPDLGQGATVWCVEEGTAEELLTAVEGGAKRLSSIELNWGLQPITVLQCLMHLEEERQVKVPVLSIRENVLVPVDSRCEREGVDGA